MKISVPWPVKHSSQSRVEVALSLWPNKSFLVLCGVESSTNDFVKDYEFVVMQENSTKIGSEVPKCFIAEMLMCAIKLHPNEDWYGFANSDIVPSSNLLDEDLQRYEALVFHRTELQSWNSLSANDTELVPAEILSKIRDKRLEGMTDKRIARLLNIEQVPCPRGVDEWNYLTIQQLCANDGEVFFWGQDMFLFRRDVVHKILDDYLIPLNPVISTGGYDPRLSRYLMDNYKAVRVLNKIFHQRHDSEWNPNEPEYLHNGGDLVMHSIYDYYGHDYIASMQKVGYSSIIPRYLKFLVKKNNPEKYNVLFGPDCRI